MRILHLIPRFLGGGPERALLAMTESWSRLALKAEQEVAVLDGPLSLPLLLRARRLGLKMTAKPTRDVLDAAIAQADLVVVHFWNHPLLLECLQRPLPACRLLIWAKVAGFKAPQVLFAELGELADALLLTLPSSTRTPAARRLATLGKPLHCLPSLADMTRLEGFQPRPHTGTRVGYLGMVSPVKLHPRFAEHCCAAQGDSLHFEIYGDGDGGSWLSQRFEALGGSGRFSLHGHVEDLRAAFAEIDIFGYPLAPNAYATSEKPLQEAMWAGLPPVVLAGTAAAEWVQDGHTGVVCAEEHDYAAAITALAADPALRLRLGRAAATEARHRFDPDRNGARHHALFQAVAALPRRQHIPLPGLEDPAAQRFIRSLGDQATEFRICLEGAARHGPHRLSEARAFITTATAVLAHGEGGLHHYAKTYPRDGQLQRWAQWCSFTPQDEDDAEHGPTSPAGGGTRPAPSHR
ncbi:glycosyltransferase family 4 protein [Synechococcus sp. ATX 2A4]|uniref:glycosyltransferase n=1 Tax=Synechococcus sp. ATX 2A4 TaxID=2823727 RepID=UPI0020CD19AD|nr:glycosyltransferase [Synechococcus sp. ATX 2A4]MCP9885535.1 glycosyltransferase family 4 protein [Synechococcus sp. ATX 2A4]